VPDGVQGYDRYAYVSNSPINHNDPSGHCEESDAKCRANLAQTLPKPSAPSTHSHARSKFDTHIHSFADHNIHTPAYFHANCDAADACSG